VALTARGRGETEGFTHTPTHRDLPGLPRPTEVEAVAAACHPPCPNPRQQRLTIPLAPILTGDPRAEPCHGARLRPPAVGFAREGTGLDDRLTAGAAPAAVHGNLGEVRRPWVHAGTEK
jgi:hypothetical protein